MYIFVYTFVKLISTMKKHLLILATALLSISTFSQIPSYVPANGLVGWWPFNGDANDESGNGNHGTVNGAILTQDRFGNSNMAYSFDGVSQNIEVSNSNSLNSLEISISVWIYPLTNDICIISKNDPSNANEKSFRLTHQDFWQNQHGLSTRYGNGLCNTQIENGLWGNSGSVPNGIWSHIVTTVSYTGFINHYLNGVLLESTQSSPLGMCNNVNSTMRIGGLYWIGEPGWFNGKIDDVGIWDRVLTLCEIQNLYQSQVNYVSQAISAGLDQSICAGDNVTLNGAGGSNYQWNNNVVDGQAFTPNQSANYVLNGTDSLGCQGTDTVVVTVLENAVSTLTQTALDSYTLNGQTYTQSGTYTQTLPASNGCDSTITLNLTLNFTGMNELGTGAKKLVKITDLNGKIIPCRKNTLMLFIYEDGTVERVVEMEE
jgi:hypothetical protein